MATKKSKTTKKKTPAKKTQESQSQSMLNKLESMEQTTGKEYTDQVRTLESVLGVKEVNEFGTSNARVFEENISEMTLVDMQTLAVRVGVMPSPNKPNLKKRLLKAFNARNKTQGIAGQSLEQQVKLNPESESYEEALKIIRGE